MKDKVALCFKGMKKKTWKCETMRIYGAALYMHSNSDPPNGFLLNNNGVSWCRQKT